MTVLHLSNDYSGSTVYMNLCRALDDLSIRQIVYHPLRDASGVDKNRIPFETPGSGIIYSPILSTYTRINYPAKIKRVLQDVQQKINVKGIDVIHAHTWYSDGGVAYYLSKKYDIPYIVTIRNTDLNLFQKRLFYVRPFGRKILQKAQKVILIASSYKKRVLEQSSVRSIETALEKKIKIIPNGVDAFWIKNRVGKPRKIQTNAIHVLYIGNFRKSKNVPALLEAVKLFSFEEQQPIKLHIVGGGGRDTKTVISLVQESPDLFEYYGKVYDKNKLKVIFGACDIFAMPSLHETFGLVYVEAMLQGLPILFRKNEGIDGFYTDRIGEAVSVGNAREIKEKLTLLYKNYMDYRIDVSLVAKNHDWNRIAQQYSELYTL